MTKPYTVSEAVIEQRRQAPRKHGLRSNDWNDIQELRVLVASKPGRLELREELTAQLIKLVLGGYAYLETERGLMHKIDGKGPMLYLGWASNLLARLLKEWPSPIDTALHVAELKKIDDVLEARREREEPEDGLE